VKDKVTMILCVLAGLTMSREASDINNNMSLVKLLHQFGISF